MERFSLDFKKDGLLCVHLLATSQIEVRDALFLGGGRFPCFSCNVFLIP